MVSRYAGTPVRRYGGTAPVIRLREPSNALEGDSDAFESDSNALDAMRGRIKRQHATLKGGKCVLCSKENNKQQRATIYVLLRGFCTCNKLIFSHFKICNQNKFEIYRENYCFALIFFVPLQCI